MNDVHKTYRRTHFIVKPEIQIKYVVFAAGAVVLAGLAIYAFTLLSVTSAVENTVTLVNKLTPAEASLIKDAIGRTVFIVTAVLVILVAVEGILLWHRITGPIYALQQMMRAVGAGNLSISRQLREKDELKDVAADFYRMIHAIAGYVVEDKQVAEEIRRRLDEVITNKDALSISEINARLTVIQGLLGSLFTKFRL
jgi:methyl-accepting chemotaxis protein